MEKDTISSIEVKSDYISIDFTRRFLTAITVCIISFLLILIGLVFLTINFDIPVGFLAILSIVPSIALGYLPFSSQKILRSKALKWSYKDFKEFEIKLVQILALTFAVPIIYVIMNHNYANDSLWTSVSLYFGLIAASSLLVFLILSTFQGFYTLRAKVTLGLLNFLHTYKQNSDLTDFTALIFASKRISKIAQDSNMEIDQYKLCLGLSIGCIQNHLDAEKDIVDFARWAQEPRNSLNFLKFRQNIVKYTNLALDASDCGITERSHWTFEKKTAIIGALIVPVVVSLLAIIIPKLLEIFHF
jgi:hypothetical protein